MVWRREFNRFRLIVLSKGKNYIFIRKISFVKESSILGVHRLTVSAFVKERL